MNQRMQGVWLWFLAAALLTSPVGAQSPADAWSPQSPSSVLKISSQWSAAEEATATSRLEAAVRSRLDQSMTDPAPVRKPGVAFLLSALVPGTGQLYNGNRRGYLFLGLEMGSWFARSSFIDAGNKKEGDAEAYARRHWSYERFFETRGDDGCLFTAEGDSLIRSYADSDLEQYYDELNTSDTYRCGWDDFRDTYNPENSDVLSPRREEYRDRLDKANTLKSRADLALGILVVNRVVSAVDAFRVARGRQQGASPSLRLHSSIEGNWESPKAVFRLTKELR